MWFLAALQLPNERRSFQRIKHIGADEPSTAYRRALLEISFTGNWEEECIEVMVPASIPQNKIEAWVISWATLAAEALYPKAIGVFARSRWHTSLIVGAELALLANCHNLFQRVVPVWLDGGGGPSRNPWAEVGPQVKPAKKKTPADEAGDPTEFNWEEFNSTQKNSTRSFAANDKTAVCNLLWCLVQRPGTDLLCKLFEFASTAFDEQQDLEAVRGNGRRYRLTEAASGRIPTDTFAQLHRLLTDPGNWSVLPKVALEEVYQSLAFAMITRLIAGLCALFAFEVLGYPYRFWLLVDPDLDSEGILKVARMLLADKWCMLDPFSKLFRQRYPTVELLTGKEARGILLALAVFAMLDTCAVECRFAFLRRIILLRSQTWQAQLAEVSADWIFMRSRRIEQMTSPLGLGKAKAKATKAEAKAVAAKAAKAGTLRISDTDKPTTGWGGGTQRSFISDWIRANPRQRDQTQSGHFKAANLAFAAMVAESGSELAKHRLRGERARDVSLSGGAAAFGRTGRKAADGSSVGMVCDVDTSTAIVPFVDPSALALAVGSKDDAVQLYNAVRLKLRRRRMESKLADEAGKLEVARWQTAAVADSRPQAFSSLAAWTLAEGVRCCPLPVSATGLLTAVYWFAPARQMTEMFLNTASKTTITRFADAWSKMHNMFDHETLPDLPEMDEETARVSKCFVARMCLCDRPQLVAFTACFLTAYRRAAPPHSVLRLMTSQNLLVLRLSFQNWDDLWLLPAYINLSTFVSHAVPLVRDVGPRMQEASLLSRIALLPAHLESTTLGVGTWWQVLDAAGCSEEAVLSGKCDLSFYTICSDRLPLLEFKPSNIFVKALDTTSTVFWDGVAVQSKPRPKAKAGAGKAKAKGKAAAVPLVPPAPSVYALEDGAAMMESILDNPEDRTAVMLYILYII